MIDELPSHIALPAGVTFDGIQRSPSLTLLCFTVVKIEASFSVGIEEATSAKVADLAANLERMFRIPGPVKTVTPPLTQRAPRQFLQGGEIFK